MTARDRFQLPLRCPECGREGDADVSQEDGYSFVFGDRSTRLDSLPDGFKRVAEATPEPGGLGFDIQCIDHAVSALGRTR